MNFLMIIENVAAFIFPTLLVLSVIAGVVLNTSSKDIDQMIS